MLDGLFMLLALSTLMAIASFVAGSLPLSFTLSAAQLKVVTTLGMGVLVGTSLIVIIPEGVETLYSANEIDRVSARGLGRRSLQAIGGRNMGAFPLRGADAPRIRLRDSTEESEWQAVNALPGPAIVDNIKVDPEKDDGAPPKTPTDGTVGALAADDPLPDDDTTPDEATHHAWMGISLIGGFILMYLIDTLPALQPASPPQRTNIYSLSDLGASQPSNPSGGAMPRASFSTTLGLVIHAAADGIALGASSTQPALSFVIFLAIMVHKAPAAFGLTSILLKQGLGKRQARVHLVAFSLAAPAGALVAWILIGILGGGGKGDAAMRATKWWTGMILLFSGGTFLYVAMHTMQDNSAGESGGTDDGQTNGYLDVPSHRERYKPQKSLKLVLVAVGGMLLPLITQVGHAH